MPASSDEFYRIQQLPPYVFAVINEMRAKARAAQIDVIDLGMGNPDGATPRPIVNKLIEASRNARNHRYSQSRGIPKLREEITRRYQANYGVDLDPEREAIVTIGAKDALAHLLFATVGPDDAVVSPNPAYPIHQYGVLMAEGHACLLPMPDAATFLARLEELFRTSSRKPKMIPALARIKSYLDYGVFQPIQIASIIALRECEEDTRKICALYQRRRDVLVTGLKRAGWEVEKPRGSMFLWAQIPEKYRAK